jgi:peptide/nickel transport system permease protein
LSIYGPSRSEASDLAEGIESAASFPPSDGQDLPPGIGPWQLAWRRLRRNRVALFFGGVFLLIVVMCLLAPLYADDVAHVGPNVQNITGTITENGRQVDIVSLIGIPIGPTWHLGRYFLGADEFGRDIATRLLYGGRASLEIGAVATILTMVLATILGLLAGYFRGITDGVISRVLDVIWAYPAVLLGITLGTVLAIRGLGPLKGTTLMVDRVRGRHRLHPLHVARPIRAQVLTLREREFVDAARQQGLSQSADHVRSELLPNLSSTIIVFIPLILANAILLEAALTFPRRRRAAAQRLLGHDDQRRDRQRVPGGVLKRAGPRHHAGRRGRVGQHLRRRPARRA